MKKIFVGLLSILLFQQAHLQSSSKIDDKNFRFEIFLTPNKSFGYIIYQNNRQFINQSTIPSRPGNDGFATKEDAAKVAMLVIEKIKKGIMPPTVTLQELQQLKIKL